MIRNVSFRHLSQRERGERLRRPGLQTSQLQGDETGRLWSERWMTLVLTSNLPTSSLPHSYICRWWRWSTKSVPTSRGFTTLAKVTRAWRCMQWRSLTTQESMRQVGGGGGGRELTWSCMKKYEPYVYIASIFLSLCRFFKSDKKQSKIKGILNIFSCTTTSE